MGNDIDTGVVFFYNFIKTSRPLKVGINGLKKEENRTGSFWNGVVRFFFVQPKIGHY